MKSILMIFSLVILRCCWGPTEYQLMTDMQNDDTILKELDGKYNIKHLKYEDVSDYNLNITFNESSKQVSGFSGCNRFFGPYSLNNNTLNFGEIGSTKMLCDENANEIEVKLFKVFKKANSILFSRNGFSLYNKKKFLLSAIKEPLNEPISIEYSSSSMGGFKKIIINKKTISVSGKKSSNPKTEVCKKEYWDRIIETIDAIDISTISSLEAPSKDFLFDGAPLANLKISFENTVYVTPPFDHGNPNKNIAPLIKEILSIAENIE